MLPALALALLLAAAPAPPGVASLQYLGHSCFVVTTPSGARLLIDPYATGEWPGLSFPYTHADRVLVTHPHWDHSAWRAVRGDPKLIDAPGSYSGKDYRIRGIAGRHADVGGAAIEHRNTIFVIETSGLKLCHLGDNGPPADGLKESIGAVDILMLPVDSERRVLTYEQAQAWIDALAPRAIVPMHYRVPGLSLEHVTGLGTPDEWLASQPAAARMPSDTWVLDPASLPPAGSKRVSVLTLPGQKPPDDPGLPAPGKGEALAARRRGEIAAAEGDLTTALSELTRAAALDPNDAEVLQKLGYIQLGRSRPDLAADLLTRAALAAGEGEARSASLSWLGAGMAFDLIGRRDQAVEAYGHVVKLGVNDEGQVDRARRYLETAYTED